MKFIASAILAATVAATHRVFYPPTNEEINEANAAAAFALLTPAK